MTIEADPQEPDFPRTGKVLDICYSYLINERYVLVKYRDFSYNSTHTYYLRTKYIDEINLGDTITVNWYRDERYNRTPTIVVKETS